MPYAPVQITSTINFLMGLAHLRNHQNFSVKTYPNAISSPKHLL